jgi:hypothetical protein
MEIISRSLSDRILLQAKSPNLRKKLQNVIDLEGTNSQEILQSHYQTSHILPRVWRTVVGQDIPVASSSVNALQDLNLDLFRVGDIICDLDSQLSDTWHPDEFVDCFADTWIENEDYDNIMDS